MKESELQYVYLHDLLTYTAPCLSPKQKTLLYLKATVKKIRKFLEKKLFQRVQKNSACFQKSRAPHSNRIYSTDSLQALQLRYS